VIEGHLGREKRGAECDVLEVAWKWTKVSEGKGGGSGGRSTCWMGEVIGKPKEKRPGGEVGVVGRYHTGGRKGVIGDGVIKIPGQNRTKSDGEGGLGDRNAKGTPLLKKHSLAECREEEGTDNPELKGFSAIACGQKNLHLPCREWGGGAVEKGGEKVKGLEVRRGVRCSDAFGGKATVGGWRKTVKS